MADITYRLLLPGQRHFDCASLHAMLDTKSCADRWARAMQPDSERLILCKRCPIGRAHHAEHFEASEAKQPVRASLCVRCGRPAARMINHEICPSCWNRAAEWRKGRNARGNLPATYVPPVPRRVGIYGEDGRPVWTSFVGQNIAESMARAVRAGLGLSDAQPGRTHWNTERQAFEYRDAGGRVLIELEIDGRVEYVAIEQLHHGEQPAAVAMPTMLLTPDDAAVWFTVSGEGEALGVDRHQTEFGCAKCRQGMLHAHRAQGEIHIECSAGCS